MSCVLNFVIFNKYVMLVLLVHSGTAVGVVNRVHGSSLCVIGVDCAEASGIVRVELYLLSDLYLVNWFGSPLVGRRPVAWAQVPTAGCCSNSFSFPECPAYRVHARSLIRLCLGGQQRPACGRAAALVAPAGHAPRCDAQVHCH